MSKRALISVTDKSGVVEFARELNNLGYEVISTGNTFKILKENGVNAIDVYKRQAQALAFTPK